MAGGDKGRTKKAVAEANAKAAAEEAIAKAKTIELAGKEVTLAKERLAILERTPEAIDEIATAEVRAAEAAIALAKATDASAESILGLEKDLKTLNETQSSSRRQEITRRLLQRPRKHDKDIHRRYGCFQHSYWFFLESSQRIKRNDRRC